MSAVVGSHRRRVAARTSTSDRAERRVWVLSGSLIVLAEAIWMAFGVIGPNLVGSPAGSDASRAGVLALIAFAFPAAMSACSAWTWFNGRESAFAYVGWIVLSSAAAVAVFLNIG